MLLNELASPDAHLEWVYPTDADGHPEPQGLEFLRDQQAVMSAWGSFWPQKGRQQTWDGVARLRLAGGVEWVLIEAKANAVEFVTPPCGASEGGGLSTIRRALSKVQSYLDVHQQYPWTGTYYQYANRLAVLYFLNHIANVPARLVQVYFTGDVFPDGRECPQDDRAWQRLVDARDRTLGLSPNHPLSARCHTCIIPVFKSREVKAAATR